MLLLCWGFVIAYWLTCWTKCQPGRNLVQVSAPSVSLANTAMMSTLTIHCQLEDEPVKERTDQPTSYAKAKKMKSPTLHTHGCSRASLRDCASCSMVMLNVWIILLQMNFHHLVMTMP